jgi:O-antigen/teichoic acid export membrane protein
MLHGLRTLAPRAVPVPRADVTSMLGATTTLVIAMAAFQNVDILIVKLSFAPAEAGIYAAAWSFARWMALVAFPIEALLLPRLSFEGEHGRSGANVAVRLGGSMLLMGAVPLAAFVMIPSQIVTTLYGPDYQDAAPLLFYLGLATFSQYACYLIVQVLVARAHTWPLAVFAAAGIVETAIIAGRHDSLPMVAAVLVTMRLATLVALMAGIFAGARTVAVPRRA